MNVRITQFHLIIHILGHLPSESRLGRLCRAAFSLSVISTGVVFCAGSNLHDSQSCQKIKCQFFIARHLAAFSSQQLQIGYTDSSPNLRHHSKFSSRQNLRNISANQVNMTFSGSRLNRIRSLVHCCRAQLRMINQALMQLQLLR